MHIMLWHKIWPRVGARGRGLHPHAFSQYLNSSFILKKYMLGNYNYQTALYIFIFGLHKQIQLHSRKLTSFSNKFSPIVLLTNAIQFWNWYLCILRLHCSSRETVALFTYNNNTTTTTMIAWLEWPVRALLPIDPYIVLSDYCCIGSCY